jgi:hypothetical protein
VAEKQERKEQVHEAKMDGTSELTCFIKPAVSMKTNLVLG